MQKKIVTIVPWCVTGVGFLVLIGWVSNIDVLIRVHSQFTSMKFITAFLFVLCGIQLFLFRDFLLGKSTNCRMHYFLIFSTITILIVILCIAISIFPPLGSILDIIPVQKEYEPWAVFPLIPSLVTLLCFLIVASVRIFFVMVPRAVTRCMAPMGTLLILVGTSAVIGNILSIPLLFYATRWAGGMAIHTAFLFALIGWYFIALRKEMSKEGIITIA